MWHALRWIVANAFSVLNTIISYFNCMTHNCLSHLSAIFWGRVHPSESTMHCLCSSQTYEFLPSITNPVLVGPSVVDLAVCVSNLWLSHRWCMTTCWSCHFHILRPDSSPAASKLCFCMQHSCCQLAQSHLYIHPCQLWYAHNFHKMLVSSFGAMYFST